MAKQILDWNYNPIQEKDIPKQKHTIFYEYDNPEEALTDLSNEKIGTTRQFCGEASYKFDKITTPIVHNGIKLTMYFTWNDCVFAQLFGIYQYIGKMV